MSGDLSTVWERQHVKEGLVAGQQASLPVRRLGFAGVLLLPDS